MTTTITVKYEGDLLCNATHGPSGATLRTDAPKDNEGQGRFFSPTDLVGTALGTCMMAIMGIVARRNGIRMEGATARVEKTMSANPRRIGRLTVEITMPGLYTAEQKQKLEAAARSCPVHASLHPGIESPITFLYPDA
jgi:putative redox protein